MGGVYCENCDVAPVRAEKPVPTSMADAIRLRGVAPYAIDEAAAERLWSLSVRLLGPGA
jgi:hypothetical protein